ncbi:hypothetical protein N7E81_10080 [Reichenbachiella carrageenanivorans]|uniref:Uncharacterized protein n=1 Tax=Reichenbachiella carrageenanivorans TaxID=2979869 RepID=A0ABY6CUX5_9BACT|nr:hypothetical protein [Reichenbachiella carrageenanivorans]UXX77716.1 hypothetical protein N7E81_10080 [Reichenbachiella carrageenanivorans]
MKTLLSLACLLISLSGHAQYKIASTTVSGKKTIIKTKYDNGYLVLKNGTSYVGEIQLKVENQDTVEIKLVDDQKAKYKFDRAEVDYFGLGIKPDKKPAYIPNKAPMAQSSPKAIESTGKFPFQPETITEVTQLTTEGAVNAFNDGVVKTSKNELKNLQPGYALFNDGRKYVGKIAQFKRDFIYVDEKNNYKEFVLEGLDLNHIMQEVNGQKRAFTSLRQGVQAISASDPGMVFTEIFFFDQKYSYYQNPKSTHRKDGLTNLGNAAGTAASQKHVGGAVQMGEGEDEGAFFEEYFILNNDTKEQWIVYKKNDEEIMTNLLKGCDQFASLSKSELKALTSMKDLDTFTQYLNTNNCEE